MNRQRKQFEQENRRKRARQFERRRRFESDHCEGLMFEADFAWKHNDLERCQGLLEKALRIRPNYPDALEQAARTCFSRERREEGLAYYHRLRETPSWPPLMVSAAVAAFALGRIDQAKQLLTEFLSDRDRADEFPSAWKTARAVAKDVERAVRSSGSRATTDSREQYPAVLPPAPRPEATLLSVTPGSEVQTETPSHARSETSTPQLELPPFPVVSVPDIEVHFEFEAMGLEQTSLTAAPAAEIFLRRDYTLLKLQKGFDELLSLGAVKNLEHFWYQLETVRRILRDFRGRALLADEVGLGKTIEACLTLKEYAMRGLVRKALILTPPSLVTQWLDELGSKFDLAPVSPDTGGYARDPDEFWAHHDLVVASLALARQPANRDRLAKIDYDVIIVDEAHYLKNRTTSAWQLVNELKKRFLLLLSATPVGNNLSELYNLILLLRPGLLGTEAQFRRDYGATRAAHGPRHAITLSTSRTGPSGLEDPVRRDKLRGLLREVMVRNTRAHIDMKLPRRLAATEKVRPDAIEAEVVEELGDFIRTQYGSATPADRLRLMMLQMQAGSSPSALRYGLREHAGPAAAGPVDRLHSIVEKLSRLERSAKTGALIALARRSREKKIIFTRFLATLEELRLAFQSEGFSVSIFHGSLSRTEKEAAIADFRDRSEILLSSESGGEGRNLQFCNTVINFDLPWNPVTIEQRVGRVHRIGQTREVYVFNFCLAGSVEEYMLKVLHEKLNLFELVTGEIEMILGELGQEQDFSSIVMDLWARSATPGERENAFERFAEELQRAKSEYQKTRELDQTMFGEDYEA